MRSAADDGGDGGGENRLEVGVGGDSRGGDADCVSQRGGSLARPILRHLKAREFGLIIMKCLRNRLSRQLKRRRWGPLELQWGRVVVDAVSEVQCYSREWC